MTANWWFALIIMVVANGILIYTLFLSSLEPLSRKAKRWFFLIVNLLALAFAISQFFWMDFNV